MIRLLLIGIFLIIKMISYATIWQVGLGHTYTLPSQVSALVADGDTVEIDAGIYESDVAHWTANNLLLKGIGGYAHLKANGNSYGGKAIWVIGGNHTSIENIEFSLCTVADQNGAGIRQEGRNLVVSHCYFHHNDEGILAGTINPSNITIEYCEFAYNGFGDGQSHNLYINHIDTLVFRYNYSHHAIVGHELKSRAHVNFILCNRISDEATGTASRSIDLPNGGTAYLIGNVIEQGPNSQNSNIIGYGLEGLSNPGPHEFYAINNTIVNDHTGGSFFSFQPGTGLFKAFNNIIAGAGSFVTANLPDSLDYASNLVFSDLNVFHFEDVLNYNYHLTDTSYLAINTGTSPGTAIGVDLTAHMEYVHPVSAVNRCVNGAIDIGAFENCTAVGIEELGQKEIALYPNPVSTMVYLPGNPMENVDIQIFDVTGKNVRCEKVRSEIDISELSPGIYMLNYVCRGVLHTKKLVKE